MAKTKNPYLGSSTDDLWKELGIHENITTTAIKRTIAIQIESEMSSLLAAIDPGSSSILRVA